MSSSPVYTLTVSMHGVDPVKKEWLPHQLRQLVLGIGSQPNYKGQ